MADDFDLDAGPVTSADVPQQLQNIQVNPDGVPSPKERPTNCPDIGQLSTVESNRCLQETLAYFKDKYVKLPDGRVGQAIGVDPRPMKGVPTRQGIDGNWLIISVRKDAAHPGRTPLENVYYMPDDLEIVDPPAKSAKPRSSTKADLRNKEIKT